MTPSDHGETPRPAVRPLSVEDLPWMRELFTERWGGVVSVSRGVAHDTTALPGFVAHLDGVRAGVVTYRLDGRECELVTLDSVREGAGVGTALVDAVAGAARGAGAVRLWLVTTNDNLRALRFYQRYGFDLAALHHDAVARSRALKPSIPATGLDGIPVRHELELQLDPRRPGSAGAGLNRVRGTNGGAPAARP
ncbi:GNAT family N-acetyltransferase [Actinoallomurus soli]|uniref:GNAT family N-acetyltransferase n=1 Tax=Actinoallomurus soli TaxID=2952535 RepID=UPI002093E93C|nr:GNAT family N-acetyltransferase [Actinoallomurus soli]MCO5975075.1 GNAT family N-acetyltransferase [Actinoallomurus soli]